MSGIRDWLKEKIAGDAPPAANPETQQQQPAASSPAVQPSLTEEQLREMRLSRFGSPVAGVVPAPSTEPQEKKMKPSPSLPVQASPAAKPPGQTPVKASVAAVSPKVFSSPVVGASPVDVIADPDEWISETMALVFRASLPQRKGGKEGVLLQRLERELLADKLAADRLSLEHVDRVLLEVLSRCHHPSTAQYLYGCYVRAREQSEQVLNKRDPSRMHALGVMQRAIVTFAAVFFSAPVAAFPMQEGRPEKETNSGFGANQLALFLDSTESEELERVRFAGDVVKTASDAQLVDILAPLLTVALRRRMGPRLLLQEEQNAMMREYRCLSTLLNFPRVSNVAVLLKQWLPEAIKTGRELERQSVLGPFFSPSSYPDDPHVGDALLLNKTTQNEIFSVYERLRHRFSLMHGALQQSLLACLKSKPSRASVTAWLVAAVNLNAGRAFMRPDFRNCSTHGFMLNLSAVCMLLCEPVGAKLQTVDANYCVFNVGGVDFGGVTRISWDDKQVAARAQQLLQQQPQPEISFNTEIFWITARALSVGWRPAAQYYNAIFNTLQDEEAKLADLDGVVPESKLAPLRLKVSLTRKDKLAAEAHVKHPDVLAQICRFYDMAARWFTITADPEKKGIWPAEPRPEIACVPQWLIDDLIFFFEWLNHHAVDVFALGAHHQNLLSFLTLLLSFDKYLHSPHLRGRVIDLFQCMLPNKNNQLPIDMFEKNKFVTKMLVPALIRFYIDCERTGGNNQFYEKFTIRYRISETLEYLWFNNDIFRNALIAECSNQSLFLRFVTLLTNDATFLLDEAIHKLEEIHELEKLRETPGQWNALTPDQQNEKNDQLGNLIRNTRSYNLLAIASVKLFRNLSTQVVDPFMSPELVDRLASMLDYFLVQLAGPKCSDLKVKNPQAVGFDPKFLLRTLCVIFVNFGSRSEFRNAIIRDERSFKQDVFVTTASILRNRISGVSEQEVLSFEAFVLRLDETAKAMVQDEPWDDEDIPEEFQDPIMSTLMRDPVTWEGSHVTCDRAVITRQLLNESIDPYTRRPLTPAQLVPVPELKKRIDLWIAEQRAKPKKK